MVPVDELPYEVRRDWLTSWDLLPLLRGTKGADLETPARYLHTALEVRSFPGSRGRGVVTTKAISAGEILLLDTPIVTADTYEKLVDACLSRSRDCTIFRKQLLSMCGDPADVADRARLDVAPSEDLVCNILRHNYHATERPPFDGLIGPAGEVGLWPLGSLVNHSLMPNVTRSFAGTASCYRSIRPLAPGDEVLDNYFDMRMPAALRSEKLRNNHGMEDEGPDAFDAPADAVTGLLAMHSETMDAFDANSEEVTKATFVKLLEASSLVHNVGVQDPAFTDIFRDFALLAGQLGDAGLCLQGCAQALELATVREPYSVISLVLTLRMLHMACLGAQEIDKETRQELEKLAREHFKMVLGPMDGAFEALNPGLVRRLADLK